MIRPKKFNNVKYWQIKTNKLFGLDRQSRIKTNNYLSNRLFLKCIYLVVDVVLGNQWFHSSLTRLYETNLMQYQRQRFFFLPISSFHHFPSPYAWALTAKAEPTSPVQRELVLYDISAISACWTNFFRLLVVDNPFHSEER